MLTKDFIEKCYREILDTFNENKTLREFLAEFMQCGIEDDCIENALYDDEYADLIDSWADANDVDKDELCDYILGSLDDEVEYEVKIDTDYDESYLTIGKGLTKEVCFTYTVLVNGYFFELGEMFRDFEVA